MKQIKKWFTLIEMLLVLGVIVIMAVIWMRYMSTLQADRAYSESCINVFYADLSDWVYYATTSRVLSWNVIPKKYTLKMVNSWFELRYDMSWANNVEYLKRQLNDYAYCSQKTRFETDIKFDFDSIEMLPSLMPEWSTNWFIIYKWGKNCKEVTSGKCATWAISMNIIWKSKTWVITSKHEFGQILFDARTWMIKKRLCTKYKDDTSYAECKEWNTWF